jgi:hypothetical protein
MCGNGRVWGNEMVDSRGQLREQTRQEHRNIDGHASMYASLCTYVRSTVVRVIQHYLSYHDRVQTIWMDESFTDQ